MTFEELGGLGEFIGALAVLVSLIYIAREIRQNTRATKLATMQASLVAALSVFDAPARDRELARAVRIGIDDPDKLSEDEFAQFRWWVTLALRVAENLFVQHKDGAIDRETWDARVRSVKGLIANPGPRKVWVDSSANYRSDFQDWMASQQAPASDKKSAP